MSHKLMLVAGARPNFMKIAPLIRAANARGDLPPVCLVHTGQHYDEGMSEVFFRELGLPKPDHYLAVGSASHAVQTAKIMTAFEPVLLAEKPACVVVVGDVNSTLACALVASKLAVPVAHVEAGLRSGDRTMPEEINRVLTDAISDWLFVTEPSGLDNLALEGRAASSVFHVGHVMIDNLLHEVARLQEAPPGETCARLKKELSRYGVVTLHRPANVDSLEVLSNILRALETIATDLPLISPVHPRTRSNLAKLGRELHPGVVLTESLGYRDFVHLWGDAEIILTDSGGLQEEATALGVRCVTLRENTERPVTVTEGTNILGGVTTDSILAAYHTALTRARRSQRRPRLWDGQAAGRILEILVKELDARAPKPRA
ncbi:MAG: UDP-N-acetylglucosamine 2-epimerase (non-hydrolyzing) [Gammaproteobacteria bacterium]|nr:UDP-N-acetylglucosamine 2-epimerase (non-hydrolyzing) [Gammaproteobacteria bacterium]